MRRYESLWVVNGDLPDEEVKSAIDKFSGIISSQGGTLVGLDEWGRRKLAYKIQGTIRGYYVIADFAGSRSWNATTGLTTALSASSPPRNRTR